MRKVFIIFALFVLLNFNFVLAQTNTMVKVMSCELENSQKVRLDFNKKDITYRYIVQDKSGKTKVFTEQADAVEQYYAIDAEREDLKREYKIFAEHFQISISDKVSVGAFDCRKNTIFVNPKALRYGQGNVGRKDFGEVYVYE